MNNWKIEEEKKRTGHLVTVHANEQVLVTSCNTFLDSKYTLKKHHNIFICKYVGVSSVMTQNRPATTSLDGWMTR